MNHSRSLALAGLLVAILCWAGNALLARAFMDDIPPLALAFWRWNLALLILLPVVAVPLWQHRHQVRAAGWRLLVVAALGITGYNSFLYTAAHTTEALNITLVNTCIPLMTVVAAGLILKEWPTRLAWLGMLIAVLGLLILISRGEMNRLLALRFAKGDLIMLIAVADWALYSVLLRCWSSHLYAIPPLALLGVMILLGVVLLAPIYLYEYSQGARFVVTPANLGAVAYAAVFASLVAYLCWNHGVKIIGAGKAALTSYLMPVFTAILAWLLLDEGLKSYHLMGGALIFSGLMLAARQKTVKS
ncbi:DMT family transporter [Pseudomonas sp. TTU2014-080ASC]|uniref:DMT family transporter n=1 Tax=Pseudomonas sp. TTU2014-080ASC TaxID=1729724 RepID=UPI000718A4F3|nr:DMT family transporter [Pseudomonas sp. TTU2014-080ASC]KRW59225.1 multidrug DMT transporter permease [Pseudomonas sp. TTU2014-080ASC]